MKYGWMLAEDIGTPELQKDRNYLSLNKIVDWKQELNYLENEFKTEAEEILSKVDNFLVANGSFGESFHCKELPKRSEKMERSVIGLKYEEMFSSKSEDLKKRLNEEKSQEKIDCYEKKKSGETKSQQLKQKILETCEIVDKGVQTAKELSEKFQKITVGNNTNANVEHVLVSDLKKKEEKSKNVHLKNIKEHVSLEGVKGLKKKKKLKKNYLLTEVVDSTRESESKPTLQVQQLPSVHIRGELQVQKIHNLEIPPQNQKCTDSFFLQPNTKTGVVFHEEEEVKKVGLDGNLIECCNCGNIINIQSNHTFPQKLDEILVKCNFNIFHPSIDKFVYDLMKTKKWKRKCCLETSHVGSVKKYEMSSIDNPKKEFETIEGNKTKVDSNKTLVVNELNPKDITKVISRKYGEKAQSLEEHHWQFQSILRNLLDRVTPSEHVYEVRRALNSGEKELRLKKDQDIDHGVVKKSAFPTKVNSFKVAHTLKKVGVNTFKKKKNFKSKNKCSNKSSHSHPNKLKSREKKTNCTTKVSNLLPEVSKLPVDQDEHYESDFEDESLVGFPRSFEETSWHNSKFILSKAHRKEGVVPEQENVDFLEETENAREKMKEKKSQSTPTTTLDQDCLVSSSPRFLGLANKSERGETIIQFKNSLDKFKGNRNARSVSSCQDFSCPLTFPLKNIVSCRSPSQPDTSISSVISKMESSKSSRARDEIFLSSGAGRENKPVPEGQFECFTSNYENGIEGKT